MEFERKIIDVWSFLHLLGGGILAGIVFIFNLSLGTGYASALAVMIIWELDEKFRRKIKESFTNKISDIVFGSAGFFVLWYLIT